MLLPLVALPCHRLPPDYMKLVIGAYAFCVRSLLIAIHKNLEIAHFFAHFAGFLRAGVMSYLSPGPFGLNQKLTDIE